MNTKSFLVLKCLLIMVIPLWGQENDSIRSYEMDQLVITGTRIQKEKGAIPSSITVITEEDIRNSEEINLLPVLSNKVPGLFLNERGIMGFGIGPRSGGGISMRGLSSSGDPANTRVLVLIDGQPQFMGIFGHPIQDAYFTSNIERVEVVRGPASILYGSNAMGGAINLITRKHYQEGFSGRGKLGYGSFNSQIYSTSLGYKNGKFNSSLSLNHAQTDGHREEGEDDFNTTGGYLNLGYLLNDKFRLSLDGNLSDTRFHDPGTIENPVENNFYDYTRGRAAFSVDNNFSKAEGAFKVFYNFGDHNFFDGFDSEDYNRGITFYQNLKLTEYNIITIGVDYKNFGGQAFSPLIPAKNKIDEAIDETDLYALIQHTFWDHLNLNLGFRWVNNSQFGSESVPQFGLTYNLTEQTIFKGSIGKAFRSPTLANLFFTPTSNPELEPERMWNYELSYLQSFWQNKINLELTGYIARGENLILPGRVIPQPGGPPQIIPTINSGTFSHAGLEFQGSFDINDHWSTLLNYSYLDMKERLPYAPDHQLNWQTTYQTGRFRIMTGLKQVSGLLTGAVMAPIDRSLPLESYTLLNLNLNFKATHWLNLYLQAENLLDQEYQLDKGYPLPGVSIMGGVHFHFQ
ncbi:MAG: TonB-dependent receptor plug domain-containing protein [Candidatus Cyclobacteriaceae bacterium M3_2C_046]